MSTCTHRYRLDAPRGDEVAGVCVKCGEEKTFPAQSGSRSPWTSEAAARGKAAAVRAREAKKVRLA